MLQRFLCPACNHVDLTLQRHRSHVLNTHCDMFHNPPNRFKCKHCTNPKEMVYSMYSRHMRTCSTRNANPPMLQDSADISDNDYNINADDEPTNAAQDMDNEILLRDPSTDIRQVIDNVKELCDTFWINMLSQGIICKSTINEMCNNQRDLVLKTLQVLTYDDVKYQEATMYFKSKWKSSSTEYYRTKTLTESLTFVKPTKFGLNDRIQIEATNDRETIRQRTDCMAQIDIHQTLQTVLQNPDIFNSLQMPSTFYDSTNFNHPFAGTRGKELYEVYTVFRRFTRIISFCRKSEKITLLFNFIGMTMVLQILYKLQLLHSTK